MCGTGLAARRATPRPPALTTLTHPIQRVVVFPAILPAVVLRLLPGVRLRRCRGRCFVRLTPASVLLLGSTPPVLLLALLLLALLLPLVLLLLRLLPAALLLLCRCCRCGLSTSPTTATTDRGATR